MQILFRLRSTRGAAAGAALLALLTGCGSRPAGPPRHHYIGLDTSASFRRGLSGAATLSAQRSGELNPNTDQLTVFRVDSRTEEIFNNHPPDDSDEIQATVVREAASLAHQRGTFSDRFWTEIAARASADSMPVTVDYFTDGDLDDDSPAARAALTAAARRLAANPHVVRVCLFGVERRNKAMLYACFQSLGPARFRLYGPTEMTPANVSRSLDNLTH